MFVFIELWDEDDGPEEESADVFSVPTMMAVEVLPCLFCLSVYSLLCVTLLRSPF